MTGPIPASRLADHMIATGELTATPERVAELLGVKPARVSAALAVARDDGSMVSVTRGLYGAVEWGWRRMRTQPPADYLDALMQHLGHRYYLAYRSAAGSFGVGHRRPRFVQVAVDSYCRDRRIGDVKVCFYRNHRVGKVPTTRKRFKDYEVTVSIPEVTVLDLVERVFPAGGGFAEVGNNLGDFQTAPQQLDSDTLIEVSEMFPCAVVQRAGYVLQTMHNDLGSFIKEPLNLDALAEAVQRRGARPVDLAPSRLAWLSGPDVVLDKRWKVRVNREIDHDLVGRSKI
ncbi:MAG: hypothetical protein OXE79_06395 [Acidimicrobiaceae bacterium]|nr:hypothetical protein [Acidimicrobiaceae bacterium]MCY4174834.1 hypothetical protein [Acidimicrobiaceae bacterium]MCY4281034.1 hypothetical protein [Acidimicrobiaceae bacterium]MCY4294884.1 hypothetical protein [Acidimicrobiaceae bacterium]